MDYILEKELSPDCLLVSDGTQPIILDKMIFGVTPRETVRLEMQRDLKEIVQKEIAVLDDNLIKYQGLEKFQTELFLSRSGLYGGIAAIDRLPLEETVAVLGVLIRIIKAYHQAGLVVAGLSPGLLKKDQSGRFLLQDPPVMNYLSKSLDASYRIDTPAEVIHGASWNEKSDIFSWGVLAYRLVTGEDPFAAKTPEGRFEKIIRIGAAPPRNLQPRLSEGFNRLLITCLDPKPEKRPNIDALSAILQEMAASNQLFLTGNQAAQYAEKAKANLKKHKMKEGVWFWLRKYGVAVGIALGVGLLFTLMTVMSGPKKTITPRTSPQKVVDYYFQAIRELNTTLLDETIHKANHSLEGLVTNLYVLNRTQQGMTQNLKDYIHVIVTVSQEKILIQSPQRMEYDLNYQVEVDLAQSKEFFQRHDLFRLEPINRIWRITAIKVFSDRHWSVKINHPVLATPETPAPSQPK